MRVKFNPSGTHIHKGFLKVRIDLYPEPTDKTYAIHHIQVPVIPEKGYQGEVDAEGSPVDQNDYNNWIDSLPRVWQLNPCLCHFVKIDADTPLDDTLIRQVFDKDTVLQVDDALSKSDIPKLQQAMKTKFGNGHKVFSADIDAINLTLSSLEVAV